MNQLKEFLRYFSWPLLLFGGGGAVIALAANGAGVAGLFGVLLIAIAFSFAVERLIPYQPEWNRDHGDSRQNILHALFNTLLNRAALWLLPLFAGLAIGGGWWPGQWPFALQVLFAVVILDAGIAAAHHASHRFSLLWHFHAVHHSPKRLYGFNGLMKHPLHQLLETGAGILPLLLLGIPAEVAVTLPFLVVIALLCQHSNADYRSGLLKFLFAANAEIHRFHHRNSAAGNCNYGLFTTLYDHVMGTFYFDAGRAPRTGEELGVDGRDNYPQSYCAQLRQPFADIRVERRGELGVTGGE